VLRNLFRHIPSNRLAVISQDDGGAQDESWIPDFPHLRLPYPGRIRRRLDPKGLHLVPYVAFRARGLVREYPLHGVLGIFPNTCFAIAAWLFAKNVRSPLFFYFMDTWHESRRHKVESALARWIEPKIVRSAESIFCVSPFLAEFFRNKYPRYAQKIVCLPHIVDDLCKPVTRRTSGNPLRPLLVFTGQIYETNDDALRNVIHAMRYIEDLDPQFVLATPDPYYRLRRFGFQETKRVKFIYLENGDQVSELQQRADILINPVSFQKADTPQIRTLFPTKTFEYLRARRPMLVHGPSTAGFVQYARRKGFAYVVDANDPGKVGDALRKAIVSGMPPQMQEAVEAELQSHSPEVVTPLFCTHVRI